MALTMTRTRTQTALNKLVELVATINGELEFLEGLLAQERPEEVQARLLARKTKLQADRVALFVTIRQFDPGLGPEVIGASNNWKTAYSFRRLTRRTLATRYLVALSSSIVA